MKRLFIALAAVAAMVGCSREVATNNNITQHNTFALNASIVTDDTRVTIGGEKVENINSILGKILLAKENCEVEVIREGAEHKFVLDN